MVNSGMHSSQEEPPNTTMFHRAGGNTPSRKKDHSGPTIQVLADAATTIASALSPRAPPVAPSTGTSPGRLIEHRSKLYKQLSELKNLYSTGILTEQQYETEKNSILNLLGQSERCRHCSDLL